MEEGETRVKVQSQDGSETSRVLIDAKDSVSSPKPKRTRRVGEPKPKRYAVGDSSQTEGAV